MILSKQQTSRLVGYSCEHLRRMVRDGQFPKPLNLNPNPDARWSKKGWLEDEVLAWLAARVAARDAGE